MKMKNNIQEILDKKGISILKLSQEMGKSYGPIHELVNRDSLDNTTVSTLVRVAEILGVEIEDLYQ